MQRLMTRMLPVLLTGLVLFTGCMPPGGGGKGGKPVNPTAEMLKMLMFMGVFFVIMYVLMIRPQQKKQKAHREMLNQVSRGDDVVTNGGIVGHVVKIGRDDNLLVEIAPDVRVRVMRTMISEVIRRPDSDFDDEEDEDEDYEEGYEEEYEDDGEFEEEEPTDESSGDKPKN